MINFSNSQNEDNYTIRNIEELPNHVDYSKQVPFVMQDDGFCNGGWFMAVVRIILKIVFI